MGQATRASLLRSIHHRHRYAGYTSWLNNKSHANEKAVIIHAACWAHTRRKFTEIPDHPTAEDIVKLIGKLYRIESNLRNNPDLDRAAYRQEHSVPVLEKIKSVLETERFRQLPQSSFGKATKHPSTLNARITTTKQ